jgi:hypothetical protein
VVADEGDPVEVCAHGEKRGRGRADDECVSVAEIEDDGGWNNARGKPGWAAATVIGVGAVLLISGAVVILDQAASLGAILLAVAIAGAASFFAARVQVEAMVRVLEGLRLLVPIVAFGVTGAVIGSRRGTLAFDQIGAQLIVVLVLALALEARFFRVRGTDERTDVMASLLVIALLATGEAYAMAAVLDGRAGHADMVGGAIAAGFAGVGVSAVLGPVRRAAADDDTATERHTPHSKT